MILDITYANDTQLFVSGQGNKIHQSESLGRSQKIEIDLNQLPIDKNNIGKYQSLKMNLFENLNQELSVRLVDVKNKNQASWVGTISGLEYSKVFISRVNNSIAMEVTNGTKSYSIYQIKGGSYSVEEINLLELPPNQNDADTSNTAKSDSVNSPSNVSELVSLTANEVIIDIVIGFASEQPLNLPLLMPYWLLQKIAYYHSIRVL